MFFFRECARHILSVEFETSAKDDPDKREFLQSLQTVADRGSEFARYLMTLALSAWQHLKALLSDCGEKQKEEG